MNSLRVAARRTITQSRTFSSRGAAQNTATASSLPLGEAVRSVAERAQAAYAHQASAEGFKAGVLYTLLAGSAATAGVIMMAPSGQKTVSAQDLL